MSDDAREELDQLAGEYVLGTLAGAHRQRFEVRMRDDPALRRMVTAWQARLGPMVERLDGVAPPPELWPRIAAAAEAQSAMALPAGIVGTGDPVLARHLGLWWCVGLWRNLAFGAVAAAVVLALWLGFAPRPEGEATPTLLAILNDSGANPAWLVTVDRTSGRIVAKPVTVAPVANAAFELWVVAGDKPLSLGILEAARSSTRALAPEAQAMVESGATLAVSREPPGGSPTGAPTGPILFTGKLVASGG